MSCSRRRGEGLGSWNSKPSIAASSGLGSWCPQHAPVPALLSSVLRPRAPRQLPGAPRSLPTGSPAWSPARLNLQEPSTSHGMKSEAFPLPAKPSPSLTFPASPYLAVLHFQSLPALEPPGSLSEQCQVVWGPVSGASGTYITPITPSRRDPRGDKCE